MKWCIYITLLGIAILLNTQQSFTEQWMKIKLRNENIVISFSTTPHRINNIAPTIQSILKQNINIDKIYLNIPYVFKRDNLEYVIPQWLSDNKKITILRTQDYGPATKILGVLEQVKLHKDSIIISIDDDIYYPKNLVLQLAYKSKQNPKHAIGLLGANPDYDTNGDIAANSKEGLINENRGDHFASILQGFSGIAYRRSFFDNSIFEIINAPKACIISDDLYISFYLAKNNIPRQILNNKSINSKQIIWDRPIGLQDDALHNLIPAPVDKHRACIAYMKQLAPNVEF